MKTPTRAETSVDEIDADARANPNKGDRVTSPVAFW
jgi:hypothetical protein